MKHSQPLRRLAGAVALVSATVLAANVGVEAAADAGAACAAGTTDPTDRSVGRQPARCEPGQPAPQPLAERGRLVLANGFRSEYVAPILLALEMGEFDRENLEVEIVELSHEDALAQMANGQVDAVNGAPSAGFFNAFANGIETHWVLGNFYPPNAGDRTVAQTGLWARADLFSDASNPDPAELQGRRIASAVGLASAISYPMSVAFEDAGIDPADLEFVQVPSADMLTALENGAADAVWMLDPFWHQLVGDDDYVLVATQTPGEPIGGIFFAPHLLDDDREVGEAFVRALIRTIGTYLTGDYHDDQQVMQVISDASGIPLDQMGTSPELLFDWEIRSATTDRVQDALLGLGVLDFDEPLPEDELVDRSIYLDVIAQAQGE